MGEPPGAETKGPLVSAPRVPLRYALPGWFTGQDVAAILRDCPGMRVTRGSRRTDLSVFHHGKRQIPATCGGRVPKSSRFSAAGGGC